MSEPAINNLPPTLRESLLAEIDPSELLRWCAQPSPESAFRRAIPPAIGLALLALAFAALMFFASWSTWREFQGLEPYTGNGKPSIFAVRAFVVFGCIIVAAGLSCLCGPWFAAKRARRTIHALTNTRILTITINAPGRVSVNAVEPGHPLHITRTDLAGNLGDLTLYPQPRANTGLLVMRSIPDPRTAERLIRATFDPPK